MLWWGALCDKHYVFVFGLFQPVSCRHKANTNVVYQQKTNGSGDTLALTMQCRDLSVSEKHFLFFFLLLANTVWEKVSLLFVIWVSFVALSIGGK